MVTVERVFANVRPGLAGAHALVRVVAVRDAVQRRPEGDAHVQQHRLVPGGRSRRRRDHRIMYVDMKEK